MPDKLEHLKMIQNIINRLAANSFSVKGWSVILISALLALAARGNGNYMVLLACFPAIAFWILDGYFLYQERLYRKWYDYVRLTSDEELKNLNYSMDIKPVLSQASWHGAMFSFTLIVFHGLIILFLIVIATLYNMFFTYI
jgi:hypothetical protein